jgi:hypothetical protein
MTPKLYDTIYLSILNADGVTFRDHRLVIENLLLAKCWDSTLMVVSEGTQRWMLPTNSEMDTVLRCVYSFDPLKIAPLKQELLKVIDARKLS